VLDALSGSINIGEFDTAVALINNADWRKILEDKMSEVVTATAASSSVLVRVVVSLFRSQSWLKL
jgi:hypothetical protein